VKNLSPVGAVVQSEGVVFFEPLCGSSLTDGILAFLQ
jgi:hypothetical protein